MPWDSDLTAEQRAAASHVGTHARLLAGPGTGKTLTLTRRIVYLVREKKVAPSDIMVLTFTRAATAELRRRIVEELGEEANRAIISTLHSYALRVILQQGAGARLPLPIRIADDFEERHIIEEDLKDILRLPRVTDARDLLNQLSADWERLTADRAGYRFPNPAFYGAWQEHRRVFGYTLRAELVYQLKHALEEGAVQIQHPPSHILVDEYQDLNPCDLAVIRRLTQLGSELYVAGDDDQSIYGFRYADPDGIRQFPNHYDPAAALSLVQCQRCGPQILALANYVAQQDPRRVPKTIVPAPALPPGEVHILNFNNEGREAEGVARVCQWLVTTQGLPPQEILILLRSDRSGAFSNPLRAALESRGLPVGTIADPLGPLNSDEGRQLLSVLRLAANPNDHLAWRTLLQLRSNGIGDTALKALYELARTRGTFADAVYAAAQDDTLLPRFTRPLADEAQEIRRLVDQARARLQSGSVAEAIEELTAAQIGDQEVREGVTALFRRIIGAVSPENLEELLRALNASLGDAEQELQQDAINIMTMHQAKGLTATAVVIVGAEDEYIPGKAQGPAIDDERRLLYVSLTRARRYLYVTHCRQRTGRQAHSGRNPGTRRRTLTRFLSGGPVQSQDGSTFISGLGGGGHSHDGAGIPGLSHRRQAETGDGSIVSL